MRSVCFIFCLFLSILYIETAVLYEDQFEIPGHEGQCYDNGRIIFYNEGDVMKTNESVCLQKKCLGFNKNSGKIRIEILTCPAVEAGPGCLIVQDLKKVYPDCCPKVIPQLPDSHISCENQQQQQQQKSE